MALDGRALPLAPVARRPAPAPPTKSVSAAAAARPPTTTAAPRARRRNNPRARRRPGPAVIGQPRVSPVDRLVSDTGILTAVLLAPLGAG